MFFWYVQAEHVTDRRRTIIWLNGGPGCSSMDGALLEIGPYRVNIDGGLRENEGSWHHNANLLFVDQPVGVGFSRVDTDSFVHGLPEMADEFILFLEKYFEIFPDQLSSEIYLAGESFAGQYIPYIARAIQKYNKDIDGGDNGNNRNTKNQRDKGSNKKAINLKGLMIGNGWYDPVHQYLTYLEYAYSMNLVTPGSELANKLEILHSNCAQKLSEMAENITVHIEECEPIVNTLLVENGGQKSCMNIYDVTKTDSYPECGLNWPPEIAPLTQYLQKSEVLSALHTPSKGVAMWQECSGPVGRAFVAKDEPSYNLLPEILEGGISILMFNGDLDFICNHIGNEKLIDALEWNGHIGFRDQAKQNVQEFYVNGKPAGRVTSDRSLTYARVYNSSHMLPYDKPEVSEFLYRAFVGLDHWNGTHASPNDNDGLTDPERQRIASEAAWTAYYRAGTSALVVIIILAIILGIVFWKSHTGNIFRAVFGGLSRWKVKRRAKKSGQGDYVNLQNFRHIPEVIIEEDEEEEV